jgi:hypothetical protein
MIFYSADTLNEIQLFLFFNGLIIKLLTEKPMPMTPMLL